MFKKSKNKKITIDALAQMVAEGFEELRETMATKNDLNATRIEVNSIRSNMATKDDIIELKKDIKILELGQENIQLRLDQMAPQFEIQSLKKRIEVVEKKLE